MELVYSQERERREVVDLSDRDLAVRAREGDMVCFETLVTRKTPAVVSLARRLFQWARKDVKLKVIPMVERELVIQALKETGGNQVQAAKLLGITRATLRKRIEKFGIQRELSLK